MPPCFLTTCEHNFDIDNILSSNALKEHKENTILLAKEVSLDAHGIKYFTYFVGESRVDFDKVDNVI
jgi:hypothetical protein